MASKWIFGILFLIVATALWATRRKESPPPAAAVDVDRHPAAKIRPTFEEIAAFVVDRLEASGKWKRLSPTRLVAKEPLDGFARKVVHGPGMIALWAEGPIDRPSDFVGLRAAGVPWLPHDRNVVGDLGNETLDLATAAFNEAWDRDDRHAAATVRQPQKESAKRANELALAES